MKLTTICNPKSTHYQKQVQIRKYHPNEEVEVFVMEDEILLFLPLDDITPELETFKPQSRKEFYEFIQNQATSRSQMISTLKYLTAENLLILNHPTNESDLISLFSSYDKNEVVEEFRKLRDEGRIEFTLVNNIYTSAPIRVRNKHYKRERN